MFFSFPIVSGATNNNLVCPSNTDCLTNLTSFDVKVELKKNANGKDFYNQLETILKSQNVTPSKITLDYLKKEVRGI